MCCEGDALTPVVEELLATRAAPQGEQREGLMLIHGPGFIKNPFTDKRDIPFDALQRQIMVRGMRVGYLNVRPGGQIHLLRSWAPQQLELIRAAVLEELALGGFDVVKPRRFWAPQHDGLLADEEDDEEQGESSNIILPD